MSIDSAKRVKYSFTLLLKKINKFNDTMFIIVFAADPKKYVNEKINKNVQRLKKKMTKAIFSGFERPVPQMFIS